MASCFVKVTVIQVKKHTVNGKQKCPLPKDNK